MSNFLCPKFVLNKKKPDSLTAFKETLLTKPADIKTGFAYMSPP